MPTITMAFNIPDEQEELDLAMNGAKYSTIIWELDQFLRSKIKHGDLPEEQERIYQEVRDKLSELQYE